MPAGYQRFYEGVGALVSGSRTYEFVLGEMERGLEWPYSGKLCWVLTSRELPVVESDGADIRLINGAVREHIDDVMRSASDNNVWLVGGGNLASQFADEGLLDEILVTVVPVVLGTGKPLFNRRLARPMALTHVQPFVNGMVELIYNLTR